MIDPDIEADSVAHCPNSIKNTCSSNLNFWDLIGTESEILGDFCISAPKHRNFVEGEEWRISNIELKDCQHNYPR